MQIGQILINALSSVFRQHGIDPRTIDFSRLISTERVITEKFDGETGLSQLIFDINFPRAQSGGIYYHYTTTTALQGIIETGEFRLYSLSNRLSEDEFRSFCIDYGLNGYTARDEAAAQPIYYRLCSDLFYTSLTERDSPHLWNVFADQGRGARISLKIAPVAERSHLRRIRYGDIRNNILIGDLNRVLKPHGLTFVPHGLSRYAAFYLPDEYNVEAEVRLLAKRVTAEGLETLAPWDRVRRDENGCEYLPLSLDATDPFCTMTIEEVVLGDWGQMSAVKDLLEAQPAYISSANLAHRSELNPR
jgi:hypothetical protein